MNDLAFVSSVLTRIRARHGGYDERAYLFVLGAIEYVQARLPTRRHLAGSEVAWACRDLAWEQFGLLAPAVLAHWGITSTRSVGQIVFALVDGGLLVAQPGDSEEDFVDVFEFGQAFRDGYAWGKGTLHLLET